MHRRRFSQIGLALIAGVLLWCRPASSEAAAPRSPNIVFIFVDDQGYYDLRCYGAAEVKTPRIDAMAKAGTRFTDYYAAAPICSPSRAGLLTGCYPRRVGNAIWVHRADSRSGIHPDELTIAELLKAGGYATACIGKWHLGFHEPFLPRNQGFDHYFGLLHNLDPVEIVYFKNKGGVPLMRNGDVVKRPADPAELTKLYTDEAIGFIEKNKEGPFFLYLPHTMLHNPLGVSETFKGSSNWGEYGDAIQELDYNVGRIFDALKRLEIDDNTIVIYASDNGRGPGRTPEQKIRGRKLSTYEGGMRVPAIAWGPGLGLQAGAESSAVVRAMDWYPTLATFAGIKIPAGRVIDGRDISPLLKGETRIVPPPGMKKSLNASVPLRRRWNPPDEWASLIQRNEYNDAFFYHGSQGALAAVRWRHWKLYLNPSLQLYDLAKDPGESKPARNREITRKLRGMAILFQDEMRLDARPAGEAPPQPRADGRTEIPPATLDSLDAKLGVTYARYGDRTLEMDIYRPKKAWGELPAVVCIHSGGWAKGTRASHAKVAQALAAAGFVAATISYRLSGEAPFPAAIHDCKAAVRFLRANAKEYGIDTEHIGAIGLSAGGHLTALLATSNGVKELEGDGGNAKFSSAIQAAVPMGAQTDLQSQRTRDISRMKDRGQIWRQFLGGAQGDKPATYRLASPLYHLDKNDAPCWFIAGETDDPSTHADTFRRRMQELSIPPGLTVIKDAPHPFLGKQVWFNEMIEATDAFFTKHLKQQRSALRELGVADEGAAQLMVDSGFESLNMGDVQETGKDQVLKKTGDWQTYRFTHPPTESGPWKLSVQVNGWGNFSNGVTVSVDDVRCQQRVFRETFDNFDPARFRTRIPNKNTEVRQGVLWTRGKSGGKYPPMVNLDVVGKDLEISFRYRHLQEGGMLWFFVDGDDGFGSVDHMLRVKLLRKGVQLQIDAHSLDPNHPDRQNNGRPADKVSGTFRLNRSFPQERVDLSANIWRKVKLTFQGDTVSITVDGKVWRKTLKHSCFNAAKRKLLWMQDGGEKGIEIDDILVRQSSLFR